MNDFDESNPSVHFYQYKWSFGAHVKADERWLPDYHEIGPADKDKVFIFNDWTFASSPSLRPFDHPVYDIWLKKCYS